MNIKTLTHDLTLCRDLALNDFKSRYAGSFFGTFWAFVSPLLTVILFWFVFTYGFRVVPVRDDISYLVWFCSGLVPWFYFADALPGASWSFVEYSYLVKKVVFPVWVLPVIKLFASLVVHAAFVLFLIALCIFDGVPIGWTALGVIYYSLCLFALLMGLSFVAGALIPFFRDVGHIVSIFLQFGVWLTPIFWDYRVLPENFMWAIHINPLFYITEGYRKALLEGQWFWHDWKQMLLYWIFISLLLFAGWGFFRRLRPHFADVL